MTRRRFDGRRALVTGGGSGIGLATAEVFRAEGAVVALLDRQPERLREAAARLRAVAVEGDVGDPDGVPRMVAEASHLLGGPPEILVNAAGIYRISPLLQMESEEWDAVVDVNLRGSFLVARETARCLVEAGRGGTVVNVSSVAAVVADAEEPAAHYGASKAGVMALSRQMAAEWAAGGIRVNAVCPGVIATPMLRLFDDPERGRAFLHRRVPLRRLGRPEEVAAVVAFLASDEASYITGAAVPVDGGMMAV